MKTMTAVGLMVMLIGGTAAASPVVQATHGVYQTVYEPGLNEIVVRRTPVSRIALNPNTQHSWIIEVKPSSQSRTIREVYTLPAPAEWGMAERKGVSADHKSCVVRGTLAPGQKYMFNTWGMSPGDPTGNYKIDVYIEDNLVQTFKFEVVKREI